jgi:hypothetical protein
MNTSFNFVLGPIYARRPTTPSTLKRYNSETDVNRTPAKAATFTSTSPSQFYGKSAAGLLINSAMNVVKSAANAILPQSLTRHLSTSEQIRSATTVVPPRPYQNTPLLTQPARTPTTRHRKPSAPSEIILLDDTDDIEDQSASCSAPKTQANRRVYNTRNAPKPCLTAEELNRYRDAATLR